jgi:hypothetical protein
MRWWRFSSSSLLFYQLKVSCIITISAANAVSSLQSSKLSLIMAFDYHPFSFKLQHSIQGDRYSSRFSWSSCEVSVMIVVMCSSWLTTSHRHLVLFTGRRYETIPSHINVVSPLYEDIVARMQDAKSPLSKYALAVTDSKHTHTKPAFKEWNGQANQFDKPDRSNDAEEEAYGAVVYPDRQSLPFPITEESIRSRKLDDYLNTLPPFEVAETPGLSVYKPLMSPSHIPDGAGEMLKLSICTDPWRARLPLWRCWDSFLRCSGPGSSAAKTR